MSARIFAVAAAVGCAVVLALGSAAVAKDDPAAIKAARDAVRKDLAAKKKHPTADLTYVIDTEKLKDKRWEFRDLPEPAEPWQGHMLAVSFPSGNATDTSPSITLNAFKCVHFVQEGKSRRPFAHDFKTIGRNVPVSEVEKLAVGYYDEFIATASDLSKDKCSSPESKSGVGPAKYWGTAVGTDKEEKRKVRKDWYFWSASTKIGTFTWWVEVTTGEKFIDVKEWQEKVDELMKNLKELSDPRLK